jgi:WD40 repeat protein
VLSGHSEPVTAVAFSPDGKLLASGSADRTIKVGEVASGKLKFTLQGQIPEFYQIFTIAFSPDGKTLFGAGGGNTETHQYPIKMWDVASGRELPTSFIGHNSPILTIAFSADGKFLASGGEDPFIKIWDVTANREYATLKGNFDSTTKLAFSPRSLTLASAHLNNLLTLWNISPTPTTISETRVQLSTGDKFWPFSLAFAPDSKSIVTGHYDGYTKLWEGHP